jgi:tetratricopeptide (TPR) repeat protein
MSDAVRDAVGLLAVARADELRVAGGAADEAARRAVAEQSEAPRDDFALRRVVRLGSALASSSTAKGSAQTAVASEAVVEASGALRAAVVRAACASTRSAQEAADRSLAELLERDPTDRAAARGALRILARRGVARPVEAASAAVASHPNELDALTTALAASGFEVDLLLAELRSPRAGAGAEALRSRLLARFARVEEAFAVADAARARDRASAPALAAAALAAAELGDDTLLAEIDDDALGAGDSVARTLAAAWLALGDAPRARDRAERAIAHDLDDARAQLLRALAILSGGRNEAELVAPGSEADRPSAADREQAVRAEALEALRALARGQGAAAADARARLAEIARPANGAAGEPDRPSADSVETLTRAIGKGEVARLRLGAACLALADDIEPSTLSASGAATAGTPVAQALASVPGTTRWADRAVTEAPALAARRQLRARLAVDALAASGETSVDAVGSARNDEPAPASQSVAARFDFLAGASEVARARAALAQVALRPRTPSSLAATARAAAASGDFAFAAAALESSVAVATGPLSARSVRALLAAASDLAQRDAASATRLEPCIDGILARMARTGPEDMLPAMRVLVLAGAGEAALERAATMLARAARTIAPSELPAYGALLQSIVAIERDPFPASLLARALVREERFSPAVRARLAASAIALDAAAGADPERTAAFIVGLVGEGVPVLARGDEPAPGLALALVRASSIASMVGDESMSEDLLRSALAASPDEPEALNNLAYRLIERGSITPEAIDYAERAAAAAPDDASILDTLGLLRYHQGRLRDDASGVGAISLFRQALRLQPESPSLSTLDHLGDALWRDGDQAGAVRAWRQIPDLALLRYPPANIARNLADFQRREFGLELVEPERFLRRQYGEIVQRADRKIQEVSRGSAPSVAPVAVQR